MRIRAQEAWTPASPWRGTRGLPDYHIRQDQVTLGKFTRYTYFKIHGYNLLPSMKKIYILT